MTRPLSTLREHPRRSSIRAVAALLLLGALLIPAVPSVSAATTCQATFTGNSTGTRDVTSSLTSFLRNHRGRQLCLRTNGIYRINGTVRIVGVSGLRLDGRNALLRAGPNVSVSAQRQQLRLESARNAIIKNLNIRGNEPNHRHWNNGRQHEHGIGIYGGYGIKLYHITIRDTYGDGIYVSYIPGRIAPSSHVTLGRLNIARAGRNGVGIVGGHYLTVSDAVISGTGLHAVDLEPDTADAAVHHVTVQRSSLRGFGQAGIYTGYAVAVDGWAGEMSYVTITANSADQFNATVLNNHGGTNSNIVFTRNQSTRSGRAYFENVRNLTFNGNVRITAEKTNVN